MKIFWMPWLLLAFCLSTQAADNSNQQQKQQQQRIVAIDGSVTEIIYALDGADDLVAVDSTSLYPAAAQKLPQVGYMRRLSTEGILSLQPTLVIASQNSGPESVFAQLVNAGVTVVRVNDDFSLAGVEKKVRTIAKVLNKESAGDNLAMAIRQRSEQALARIPQSSENPVADVRNAPRTMFILGAANRGLMAAGTHTQAQALLNMVQADNVISYQGYKPVSAEAALQANPQVVLVAYTGAPATEQLEQALVQTDANKNERIISVDTGLMLGFGPRLGEALDTLVDILYPSSALTPQSVQPAKAVAIQ